jgi:ring-1,2-phenylacetyl-CoA epoxidase subunit PaaE
MTSAHFHPLAIRRVTPEACGAVVVTLAVAEAQAELFRFQPGQFLTLRANVGGEALRRNYSICSSTQRYAQNREIDIGIKPVAGGRFSHWAAAQLKAGDRLDCMPPDGRFTPRVAADEVGGGVRRLGFAAGSGITPLLAIIASTLGSEPDSHFTLVYGNQNVNSILFNEELQDLKDRYPTRLSLIHVLSRQAQEVALLHGRLDADKVHALLHSLVDVRQVDEAFICGPAAMMDATEAALLQAGLAKARIHLERFFSGDQAPPPPPSRPAGAAKQAGSVRLQVVLDGKTHSLAMEPVDKVLDVALAAGLDLPYACRGGVCCTCRARVLAGQVAMEKNFTLEQWEMDKGFVLTCQSRPLTGELTVSYDER